MKKFIYICLLLQSYVVSVFASESMVQLDFSNNDSIQSLSINPGYQSIPEEGLPHLETQKPAPHNNGSMIQLDLDDNHGQVCLGSQNNRNQIIFDNNSLTDAKLKEKRFLQPLELSSNFLENSDIPQSPWSLREDDGIYRQRNLCRDEEINRLKILEEEARTMYSQFMSPVFDQKKYVDDRVLEMSADQLSSSATLGQNKQRYVESPTPSCCSEVLEIVDLIQK